MVMSRTFAEEKKPDMEVGEKGDPEFRSLWKREEGIEA